MSARALWTLVHRWVGLVVAGFLILAGATGALLVWYPELDRWFAAEVQSLPAASLERPALDPFELHTRLQRALPCVEFPVVDFRQHPRGQAVSYGPVPRAGSDGQACTLDFDEVFVDPTTGLVVGQRRWGDLGEGRRNLMPFVYRLHYQLAIGTVGTWIFGIVALLWTFDCFVGAYLTLPPRRRSGAASGKGWWARWRPAWQLRARAGGYKLNFDLHRAGGLWFWAMLLVLAWSSVALNLAEPVYEPVMSTVATFSERRPELPALAAPMTSPRLGWRQAHEVGRRLLEREGRTYGYEVLEDHQLSYDASTGTYTYQARTTADLRDKAIFSTVSIDAETGSLRHLYVPTGRHAGDTITMWLYALHLADIWGLPYRLFVCAVGLVVAALSVTGLVIWWKKRRARRRSRV